MGFTTADKKGNGEQMDETTRWILGGMTVWMAGLSGAVLKLLIGLARVETLLSIKSRQASRQLHSPDDHLGIDELLEKHVHQTITKEEWRRLVAVLDGIQSNPEHTEIERVLARTILSDPKNGNYKK